MRKRDLSEQATEHILWHSLFTPATHSGSAQGADSFLQLLDDAARGHIRPASGFSERFPLSHEKLSDER